MTDLEDPTTVESPIAEAIREHLELRARNAGLDGAMPLDSYLSGGDPLENHPLFKSEEQARIEETLDGEPVGRMLFRILKFKPGTGRQAPAKEPTKGARPRRWSQTSSR